MLIFYNSTSFNHLFFHLLQFDILVLSYFYIFHILTYFTIGHLFASGWPYLFFGPASETQEQSQQVENIRGANQCLLLKKSVKLLWRTFNDHLWWNLLWKRRQPQENISSGTRCVKIKTTASDQEEGSLNNKDQSHQQRKSFWKQVIFQKYFLLNNLSNICKF